MITQYENFLDEDLFYDCAEYSYQLWGSQYVKFSTNQFWPEYIIQDSSLILIHDIDKNDLRKRIEDTLQKHVRYNEISLMSFYYFTPGSHIPWHDDTKYRGAMTIYLLDGWNKNHGGLYLYNDNNTIKGLVPRKNLAIYHEGNVEHSVSALSSHSPVRTSIQIFFDRV